MAETFVCRLKDGSISTKKSEDHIFSISSGDFLHFEIEPTCKYANEESELVTIENSSIPVHHRLVCNSGILTLDLEVKTSGSLKFYVKNGDSVSEPEFIVVNPRLSFAGKPIKAESLSMITLLSRSLGHVDNWLSILRDQISIGYNFFHITPIQVLGGSKSLYCIKDPTKLSLELFRGLSQEEAFKKLELVVQETERLGAGCMVDVVLNHTAFDSDFVEDHPEATYNLTNCPYLRAAFELDNALHEFTIAVIQKEIQGLTNKNRIENQKDLTNIMNIIKLQWLPRYKLHEYFQMDITKVLKTFEACTEETPLSLKQAEQLKTKGLEYFLKTNALVHEGEGQFKTEIDYKLVRRACNVLGHSRENGIKEVKRLLPILNSYLLNRYDKHFAEILINLEGDIRYHKIEKGQVEISPANPVVGRYFQHLKNGEIVLHNGFIMGYNEVLKDFAGKEGWHYFRRNVVVWADNIKLRYGERYEDCPALWEKMKSYVVQMAKVFQGIRLDNAHGTPLEVSAFMLQAAREVNPDLYVMAELFTSDSKLDAYFVKYLGINSLVREAMNASDPGSLGGLIYSYGQGETSSLGKLEDTSLNNSSLFTNPSYKRLQSTPVPAILYDCTHDNPTPVERRKAHDALPNAAMVAMANCFVASTRGYDEFIPQQLSVITETRTYPVYQASASGRRYDLGGDIELVLTYSIDENQKVQTVQVKGEWDNWAQFYELSRISETNFECTLLLTHDFLNRDLPYKFILDNINWIHDWKQPHRKFGTNLNNYTRVTHSPIKTGTYHTMRVARGYLNNLHSQMSEEGYSEIYVHKCSNDIHMIIRQNPKTGDSYVLVTRSAFWDDSNLVSSYDMRLPGVVKQVDFISVLSFKTWGFIKDPQVVNGLKGHLQVVSNLENFGTITRDTVQNIDVLNLTKVPQAFVLVLKTELFAKGSLQYLNSIYDLLRGPRTELFNGLSLEHLNHLLWRCGKEELDISAGRRDVYRVPGTNGFNFAGIGGLVVEFRKLLNGNLLGHEICNNLRQGDWLIDYTLSRLSTFIPEPQYNFISSALQKIKQLPRSLIPKHFIKFTLLLFEFSTRYQISSLFNLQISTSLERHLLTSVSQFWGSVPSASSSKIKQSLSAGLPHFTTEYTRAWGRDTFIAFKGLLLQTSQFSEARSILLSFASVVRHGLVPNLLDSCNNPRYNSRDSTWFFLHGLQQYIKLSPESHQILQERVRMVFKSDNMQEHQNYRDEVVKSMEDIVQDIMQKHATGIEFREWNAGTRIDAHMRDEGFNVKVGLDYNTGLIYGGNKWNCGTWMDKMGSSGKAGNAGIPATPRDGSAVEIVALVYSTLQFLVEMHSKGLFRYSGVCLRDGNEFLYTTWMENLKKNFDKLYFVPESSDRLSGYYRDTFGSSSVRSDLQLRPNQCVALAIAPDLFDRNHAQVALGTITRELMPGLGTSQVGIKTLCDSDSSYRGFYDNSNDSTDSSIAHGFSYHNGPEWVWPVGYFLLAHLEFTHDLNLVTRCLTSHLKHLEESDWMSLPELTNSFGSFCPFSCTAQAWSVGPLIEVVDKLRKIS